MELTVIGCSGSGSGPASAASCYLVEHDGFALVLDLGPGAFGALWRHADPRRVDAVALSHLHPDHCLDLCALNVASRHSPGAPWPVIPVFGPAVTAERMERACAPEPGGTTEWGFEFTTWEPEQRIGPFTVSVVPVNHLIEAYAIRVEAGGHALVYSGDTGACRSLIELASGAHTLVCEASFMDAPDLPAFHLSGRQAAEHAAAAGVDRLVVTHIPPWHVPEQVYAEARPHFAGDLVLAEPGLRLPV